MLGLAQRWKLGRKVAPVAALALAAFGCVGEGDMDSAQDETSELGGALQDGEVVQLVSDNSGLVLDVEGVSAENGARTHQWTYLGTDNQHWKLQSAGGDNFHLVSVHSGKCLDVDAISQDDGAPMLQWDCWGCANQTFQIRPAAGGTFEVVATHSGKCLDVAGVSKEVGAYVQQWSCGGTANQRWRIETVGSAPKPPGKERYATLLYAVWHDYFGAHRDANGQPFYMPNGVPYANNGAFNWWGTPAFGNSINDYHFMENNDPERPNNALIDYHADLLHDGGIDFITLDLSNGEQDLIVKAAQAVAKRYSERPRDRTPQIAFFVSSESSVSVIQQIFYSGRYNDGIWFKYEGKPLILVANTGSAVPTGGALDAFTARHMWGLQDTSDKWSFKLNTEPGRPGTAFYLNGQPEEMSVCAATQASYMTAPDGRKGRNNGAYFAEQWDYVFNVMPKFVFMTAWNEWGSQNFGTPESPIFTDTFQTEYSADLEPMKGGHGDLYYQLMKENIRRFKER